MKKKLAVLAVGVAISLFAAQAATAAVVTIDSFTTSNDLFGLSYSEYNSGTTTFYLDVSAFVAEAQSITGTPSLDRKFDTISFKLLAAPNERITKISYAEALETSVSYTDGIAFTASTGSAVINNISNGLGEYIYMSTGTSASFSMSTSYDVPGMENEVDVSITNDILAFAFGDNANARVQKQYAMMEVKSSAVPIPATLWLFGSAITGLAALRRKGQQA
ncbi:MAG: VPLPA-CTERM sorting domain-containing protein [Proteobacteria bacterium]|nr:VPLPA-CTERM sorting domain-containing protein [Pseudomonadota bacterium]MBU0967175.1 VPLPA-CTERM sorting domain-containing protein [Pseudomonadota bacterium]